MVSVPELEWYLWFLYLNWSDIHVSVPELEWYS
jgi:hypothetical protein